MKNLKAISLIGLSSLLLAACSESNTEGSTESISETNEAPSSEVVSSESVETEDVVEEETSEQLYEYNEVIADNENFKATLLKIEHTYDETWDEEKIKVIFDVENKREDAIEVQARSVSLNGRMVDESIQMMSQEVAPGKVAEAVLVLQDYEGNELPTLEGDFEMLLHVFNWDEMDWEEDATVNVTFDE